MAATEDISKSDILRMARKLPLERALGTHQRPGRDDYTAAAGRNDSQGIPCRVGSAVGRMRIRANGLRPMDEVIERLRQKNRADG